MNPFFNFFKQHEQSLSQNFFQSAITTTKRYEQSSCVLLPAPEPVEIGLDKVLQNRVSSYFDQSAPLPLIDLSTILYHAASEYPARKVGQKTKKHRPYPSGGEKYPIELYLLVQSVDGLDAGLYHYVPNMNSLELIAPLPQKRTEALLGQFVSTKATRVSCMCLFSFVAERSIPKYGHLGYKVGLIESGHIAQNMQLVATARDIGSCSFTKFAEDEFHELLSLDGYNETLFYAVGLGGSLPKIVL